jgi:hypothetical protein
VYKPTSEEGEQHDARVSTTALTEKSEDGGEPSAADPSSSQSATEETSAGIEGDTSSSSSSKSGEAHDESLAPVTAEKKQEDKQASVHEQELDVPLLVQKALDRELVHTKIRGLYWKVPLHLHSLSLNT